MHCACSSLQRLFQGRVDLPRVQTRCRSARRPTDPTSDVFEDLLIELDECATCTILGRHFERVSVSAHVRDKYKILMADCEFAVVSGRTRRLFPRVRFHFWPQRRHHTCILFLSCELPRSRSRQNSREPKRQTSVSSSLLEYDLKSR